MSAEGWVISGTIVIAVLVLAWAISAFASRLDRLHKRVEATEILLDSYLLRRASLAGELGASRLLDPVSSVLLTEAAHEVLIAGPLRRGENEIVPSRDFALPHLDSDETAHARELAESELSRVLRAILDDPDEVTAMRQHEDGEHFLSRLDEAWSRTCLARRFYNVTVAQTVRIRSSLLVRALRLAGHAQLPTTIEFDDQAPRTLAQSRRTGE